VGEEQLTAVDRERAEQLAQTATLRKQAQEFIDELDPDERVRLWEQYVTVYMESQAALDSLMSRLAAGGVGITVTLATALKKLNVQGVWGIVLFLISLGCGVLSYMTAQSDCKHRLYKDIRYSKRPTDNAWTWMTRILNWASLITILAGGALLALFIHSATKGM
jgi:hypothetical protein